jgi:hypothetical protein
MRTTPYRRVLGSGLVACVLFGLAGPARAQAPSPPAGEPYPTSGYGHVDRSGLNEHIVRGTIQGITTGIFIGYALSSDTDERTLSRMVTGGILGGAAGLVLPIWLNRDGREVRSGDVVLINVAQNWGLAHGFGIPFLFQLRPGNDLTTNQLRLDLGLAAVASLTAGGVAAYLADDLDFTPGQASLMGATGIWGASSGFLLSLVLGPKPDDWGRNWGRGTIAGMLAVADLSMAYVWKNRANLDIDRGRVFVMNMGGIGGVLVGFAAAYFINPGLDNHRVIAGSLLAGGLLGIGAGYVLTEGWDEYKKVAPPIAGSGLSLVEYQGGKWGLGIPMPTLAPAPGVGAAPRVRPVLSLANGSF